MYTRNGNIVGNASRFTFGKCSRLIFVNDRDSSSSSTREKMVGRMSGRCWELRRVENNVCRISDSFRSRLESLSWDCDALELTPASHWSTRSALLEIAK